MKLTFDRIRQTFVKEPIAAHELHDKVNEQWENIRDFNRSAIARVLRVPLAAVIAVGALGIYNKPSAQEEFEYYAKLTDSSEDDRTRYIAWQRIVDDHYTPTNGYMAALAFAELANSEDEYVQSMSPRSESERLIATLAPYDETKSGHPEADLVVATRNLHALKQSEDQSIEHKMLLALRAKKHLHRAWKNMTPEQREADDVTTSLVDTLTFLCDACILQYKYDTVEELAMELATISPPAVPNVVSKMKHTPTETWREQILDTIEDTFEDQDVDSHSLVVGTTMVKMHIAFGDWEKASSVFEYKSRGNNYGFESEDEHKETLQKEMVAFYRQTAAMAPLKGFVEAIKQNNLLNDAQKTALLQRRLELLPELQKDPILVQTAQESILHNKDENLEEWVLTTLQRDPNAVNRVYTQLCSVQKENILSSVQENQSRKPIEKMASLYSWDKQYKLHVARKEYIAAHTVLLAKISDETVAQQRLIEFYDTQVHQCEFKDLRTILNTDSNLTTTKKSIIVSNWMLKNKHPSAPDVIAKSVKVARNNAETMSHELLILEINYITSVVQIALEDDAEKLDEQRLMALLNKATAIQKQLPGIVAVDRLVSNIKYLQQKQLPSALF